MKRTSWVICLSLGCVSAVHAQSPILIVNGVRVERCEATSRNEVLAALGRIDPAGIENIEVVKGAAAAKEYGPAGVDGVISVTTKRGTTVLPTICGAAAQPGTDPFANSLYSPEFVMAHQEAISLTDRQRTAIQDAVKELQSKAMVDTQFKLALAGEKLKSSLARVTVDEGAVLQQIDDMLALEREVKRAQMTLLVRIKNQLTAEQRSVLDKLR